MSWIECYCRERIRIAYTDVTVRIICSLVCVLNPAGSLHRICSQSFVVRILASDDISDMQCLHTTVLYRAAVAYINASVLLLMHEFTTLCIVTLDYCAQYEYSHLLAYFMPSVL